MLVTHYLTFTPDHRWLTSFFFLPSFFPSGFKLLRPLTTLLRIHYEDPAVEGPTKHGNACRRYLDAMTQSSTMDERKGERIHWWPFNDRSDRFVSWSQIPAFVFCSLCHDSELSEASDTRERERDRHTKNVYMRGIYRDHRSSKRSGNRVGDGITIRERIGWNISRPMSH